VAFVETDDTSSRRSVRRAEKQESSRPAAPAMAVSIVGVSTACSKDALVSSAKAVREALSTE
jgi:hypothetical protein